MGLFGCGFNGFGQLLHQTTKRCLLSPDKILETNKTAELTLTDETQPSCSDKLMRKIVSSWSGTYVQIGSDIWSQGLYGGKKTKLLIVKTSDEKPLDSVVDFDVSGQAFYYTKDDGRCFVLDTGTRQELPVELEGRETAMPVLSKISVGDIKAVALTADSAGGQILRESHTYVFRPFDCAVRFSQVSCGAEHVLLLSSNCHQVYTFGLGSRGQLGHGTTDEQDQPRLLEALESIAMDTISAGGWHSASVSAIGDLYIWGWNESGQLGFPIPKNSQRECDSTSQSPPTEGDGMSLEQVLAGATEAFQLEECAGQGPSKRRKVSWQPEELSCASSEVLMIQGTCKVRDGAIGMNASSLDPRILDTRNLGDGATRNLIDGDSRNLSNVDSKNHDDGEEKTINHGDEKVGFKDEETDQTSDETCDDAVLFEALPRILDLPGNNHVSKVSCGSRHTAAISGDGLLYTWGWGKYGQLGHGDDRTRDTPTLVACSSPDHLVKVKDVSCGAWNTLFTTVT